MIIMWEIQICPHDDFKMAGFKLWANYVVYHRSPILVLSTNVLLGTRPTTVGELGNIGEVRYEAEYILYQLQ